MGESPVIPWRPRYTLTPAMARSLMEIEAARTVVEQVLAGRKIRLHGCERDISEVRSYWKAHHAWKAAYNSPGITETTCWVAD